MTKPGCCHDEDVTGHEHTAHGKGGFDLIFHGSLAIIAAAILAYLFLPQIPYAHHFGMALIDLLSKMWWGVVLGMAVVGLMSKLPREYFSAILGRGDSAGGIFRAALAGLLLDMCSHGILMVGAKLYERGASVAQVMTFLIASPWNSLSLTIVLVALIGLKWTLVFIAGSALIAIISGFAFQKLTADGFLPANPNSIELPPGFDIKADARKRWAAFKFTPAIVREMAASSWTEGRLILKWLLFGAIIAAAIRTFVPDDTFVQYFGPTLAGLGLTLIATTIIEVCSEGSSPIGAELVTRAHAPGNGFAFLMAGVSTDYTEIMVLRELTKSWKIALALPLVTVPQVLLLGWIMNQF